MFWFGILTAKDTCRSGETANEFPISSAVLRDEIAGITASESRPYAHSISPYKLPLYDATNFHPEGYKKSIKPPSNTSPQSIKLSYQKLIAPIIALVF